MSKLIRPSSVAALSGLVYTLPIIALAQTQNILGVLDFFQRLFNGLIGFFITFAIVVFFWGMIQYLWQVDEQKAKGLQTMMWGVIAIFVMVSIWGIIRMLQNTFGVGGGSAITPGTVPTTIGNGLPGRGN